MRPAIKRVFFSCLCAESCWKEHLNFNTSNIINIKWCIPKSSSVVRFPRRCKHPMDKPHSSFIVEIMVWEEQENSSERGNSRGFRATVKYLHLAATWCSLKTFRNYTFTQICANGQASSVITLSPKFLFRKYTVLQPIEQILFK